MERMLDKITNGQNGDPFAEFRATNIEDTLIAGEIDKIRSTREQVINAARERCSQLQTGNIYQRLSQISNIAVNKCEEYEAKLCNFQTWSQNMHHILNARLADDISALDIPQEYKVSLVENIKSQRNLCFLLISIFSMLTRIALLST
jgi:lysophospholipase L1-like esterase